MLKDGNHTLKMHRRYLQYDFSNNIILVFINTLSAIYIVDLIVIVKYIY